MVKDNNSNKDRDNWCVDDSSLIYGYYLLGLLAAAREVSYSHRAPKLLGYEPCTLLGVSWAIHTLVGLYCRFLVHNFDTPQLHVMLK